MESQGMSSRMRIARKEIKSENLDLENKINHLLIVQGKIESLRNENKNLKTYFERMVDFTDRVLNNRIILKRLLKRLFYFKIFSCNREKLVSRINEQKQKVKFEEINLNLFKSNMKKVCRLNNHTNNRVCIFCL